MIVESLLKNSFAFLCFAHHIVIAQQGCDVNPRIPARLEVLVDAHPFFLLVSERNDVAEEKKREWPLTDNVIENQARRAFILVGAEKYILNPHGCLRVA